MRLTLFRHQLFPHLDAVHVDAVSVTRCGVILSVSSRATRACCPACRQWSRHVHSRFVRTLADLPSAGRPVLLHLSGRRYFCDQRSCRRRTFREQVPHLAPASWRHTAALHQTLERLGLMLGGRPATRLARAQGLPPLQRGPHPRSWRPCRECTGRAPTRRTGERVQSDSPPSRCTRPICPSRMAFLRAVRIAPLAHVPTPRQLGVGDWAGRRGKTYGTLLVDLERHCVVELLPDRTADTFATWLQQHPGVELVSRDRFGAYAEGAQRGAPRAVQVADRFHLVKNLVDALETFFLHKGLARAHAAQALAASPKRPAPETAGATGGVTPTTPAEHDNAMYRGRRRGERRWAQRQEEASEQRHAPIVARYEQICVLRDRGLEQREIGRRLGISRKTVMRYLQLPGPPPRRHWRQRRGRVLDAFEPYLLRRWDEGCHSGRRLWEGWREIQAQGYAYSLANVARFVAWLRRDGPPPPVVQQVRGVRRQVAAALTSSHGPSARQAAFLLLRPATYRQPEEVAYLDLLVQADAEIARAVTLTGTFRDMVHEGHEVHEVQARSSDQSGERLADWIAAAQASGIAPLRRFAQGLSADFAAVLAGLTLPASNGQLEGQINRLKMIKRQMYGRANFDLLRRRVLADA
jgi:transposase